MTEPESAELSRARKAADALARASAALDDPAFWGLKACIGVNLFYWHLDAFETGDDPVLAFIDLCRDAAAILDDSQGGAAGTRVQLQAEQTGERGISTELGALYSTLYSDMTDVEYFQESRQALAGRLTANDIDPRELFGGRIVLDAGCGGGKFTQAIAYFGASRVIGIDIGEGNIAFAREQAKKMSPLRRGRIPHRVDTELTRARCVGRSGLVQQRCPLDR